MTFLRSKLTEEQKIKLFDLQTAYQQHKVAKQRATSKEDRQYHSKKMKEINEQKKLVKQYG